MLLNCGANPNKTDIQLSNSLHYSLMASNTNNIFTLLLPLMRNINKPNRLGLTPLMIAALTGKPKEMARLVKRRAEISLCNQKGLQSIHFAAQKGDFDCLKILVEEGADVNAQIINPIKKDESTLETPAHLAAQSGNYKCLNYLFSQGANMNLRDAAGRTPVEVALSSKNKPLEKLIKQFPYYHNMEN
jgi:ankyrin repeat protein